MKENLINFNDLFEDNVNDDDLIDDYLDKCYFMGIMSKAFELQFGSFKNNLNEGKQFAIEYFINYMRNYAKQKNLPMKIGFSDDDIQYSNAAKELFLGMEKSLDFMENFYVFDTSNPQVQGGIKTKI